MIDKIYIKKFVRNLRKKLGKIKDRFTTRNKIEYYKAGKYLSPIFKNSRATPLF